jgi:L-asparaginase II
MSNTEPSDLAPLVALERNGLNESFHHGIAVLVDPKGSVLEEHGNGQALIYPRSSLKPLQALTLYRLGLRLPQAQTVLTMASHHSTQDHISQVEQILAGAGVSQSALGCPPALPWNPAMKAQVSTPASIYHNCSGKHAGFLATAALMGWDLGTYLSPAHPMQVAIHALIEELSGEQITKTAVDGCGAPLHAMSSIGLARGISRFVLEAKDLVAAALAHPSLIGDASTPDAAFLRAGFYSKLGAEGVFTVGTPDGHALSIKIADGSLRAAPAIALAMLSKHGLASADQIAQIESETKVEVLGGGVSVGGLRVLI